MNNTILANAEETLKDGLLKNEYTCAVWLVSSNGKIAASGAIGRLGGEAEDPESKFNSVFDLASLTKPIATATSFMILVDRGKLRPDMFVSDFFPEYDTEHLAGITLAHMLTHTSGIPAWYDFYSNGQTRDQVLDQIIKISLGAKPGERYEYSCLGYILLGFIIERVSGLSLSDFARINIFEPLGMRNTCFNPPNNWHDRIARTANCPNREGVLCGVVQDGNASAMEGISGNAGLFSTADDLAVFARMMLNSGALGSTRILSEESVRFMLTNRIDPGIGGQSYGFFTKPNGMVAFGESFSDRAFGHTGFTGTSLLIDPEHDIFVILLTNRIYPKHDASDYLSRRRLFHNIIASALSDQ